MSARKTRSAALFVCALLIGLVAGAGLAAAGYEVYSVRPGETLSSVAQRFGVSASRIAELNGLGADAQLQPGQSLTVPASPATGAGTAQDEFAAEEKAARDVASTDLSIHPAAEKRNGPVVGLLGVARDDVTAVVHPRSRQAACAIKRGSSLCVSCQWETFYGVLMSDGAVAWVPKKAVALRSVELVAGIEVAGVAGRSDVVQAAFRYYGTPYYYGGTPPGPTDCSGFVQAVFREFGLRLPRTAAEQFFVGYGVRPDQLAVGDRIYFFSGDGSIGHTGIYIGNGQFIHASSRRGYVGVDSLHGGFYERRFAGARRP